MELNVNYHLKNGLNNLKINNMENNNSVCYVAKINEIKPIDGADNIELAVVGGWNCIVKKDAHNVGELVICATTDAVIPFDLSEKLGVTNYLRNGGRVRTVKLRGVYSESLIIPYTLTPIVSEGDDMMDYLGIYKYEPPVKMVQLASGRKIRYQDNPHFHVYYKFPNLKNVPGMFTEDDTVEITRKIHGTNARYGIVKKTKLSILDRIKKLFGNKWTEYEFVVGSHNVEKGSDSQGFYDTNVWYDIERKYDIKNKLWDYVKSNTMEPEIGDGITLYGEIYGAGIQKGYDYGLTEIKFVGFDVKENSEYLSVINARLLIKDILELPYVEILHYGSWSQEVQDKYTFNNFIPNTKVPEEGIVIKHQTGERQKIAKVINPDYLIFAEKHNVEDSH
jgi:RNA ligase (TIGR02306 family)